VKLGAFEAGLRGDRVVYWTLTEPGTARSWDASSAALSKLLAAETERLRRRSLGMMRWVTVPELQKRGAVHWHLLAALPDDSLVATSLASKHKLHNRAVRFGFGFQADVQYLGSSGELARSSGYLAKYLSKDARVADSFSDRFRRVRSSTGTRRWTEFGTVGEVTRDGFASAAHARELRAKLEAAEARG
jgi:hypothetical protein